jgi:hypothetical protein
LISQTFNTYQLNASATNKHLGLNFYGYAVAIIRNPTGNRIFAIKQFVIGHYGHQFMAGDFAELWC